TPAGPGTPGTPVNPAQPAFPPTSEILPISEHRSDRSGGNGVGDDQEAALASPGRSLAFTGASVNLLAGLGLGLALAGFALCLVRRRVTV
ncbi:MAG: hypothetical protein ABIQ09_08340, partial [Jatrophihabitantaceae bacterium]